jgi:hypothetical protein
MRFRHLIPLVAAAGVACTDPGLSIRAELMRLPDAAPLSSAGPASRLDPPWTSSVTLTSVRSPITEISIHGSGTSTLLFECTAATSAGCRIELNGPALESLLPTTAVDVQPGTYDEIHVGYCRPGESAYTAQLTASAVLGGTTYYTRAAGNQLGTTGPAQPVNVSFTGCGSNYPILPPLVVTDTLATVLLRLYFDIRDLAFMALNNQYTNHLIALPGCSSPSATGFICAAYTSIFAVPGTALPTVERYRVNTTVTIGLVFDAGDRFVGGYNRRYYIEDAPYEPGINGDGHYDQFTPSGPGTWRLVSGGGGNDFPAFQRASHSGTVSVLVGGPTPIITIPYTALRLP